MKTNNINQKKVINKTNKKINLAKYLSNIISLKSLKKDNKNKSKNYIEYSEIKSENQNKLLEIKESEIKTLKLKCAKLQEENNKYIQQKKNYLNNNNENTSSNFPLKNEIKELWEKFAKIDLLNNFIDFENKPEIIFHIISELFILSKNMIKEKREYKYKEILKIMGIKNNSMVIKDIELQFKNFIKEHLNEIFNDLQNQNFIYEYKNQIKNIFNERIISSINNKENKDEFLKIFYEILEENEFNEMIKDINDLILYTQYNEPSLFFNIEPNIMKRKIKLVQIQNKKKYIIPNDSNKKNLYYIIILNPPELKNGIFYFNNLKSIIMPFNGNYPVDSVRIIQEEEIKKLNNNEIHYNSSNNAQNLSNNLNQKNNQIMNNFSLINNNNEHINEDKVKKNINNINSSRIMSSRESKNIINKNRIKLEINKYLLNKQCEKYWKTLNNEKINHFESLDIKKTNKKNQNNKILNISNEIGKKIKITNCIHNKRRKNSIRFKNIMNYNKSNNWAFESEELAKTDFKKEINEFDKIKNIKNKNKLFNSQKSINVKNNNSNTCLNNSSKRNGMIINKYKNNDNKLIQYKKDNKIFINHFINENKNIINKKLINDGIESKKSNLSIEVNSNKALRYKNANPKNTNNDIRYKIKNFNINYINIGDSGSLLDLSNSNIYNSNMINKSKIIKENIIKKNNLLYIPIDDIQKILEAKENKLKGFTLKKNRKNNICNKMMNKTLKNKNNFNNDKNIFQKNVTWIKKDNLKISSKRKSNSNNISSKGKIDKSKEKDIKLKNKKSDYSKYKTKDKLNIYKKAIKTSNNNNICDYSKKNSTINSEKKTNNKKENEFIFNNKLFKDIKKNIWTNNEEKNPLYIKLLKSRKINISNNSHRRLTFNGTNFINRKAIKDYKVTKSLKNTLHSSIGNNYENNKINKSTSNILYSKFIN